MLRNLVQRSFVNNVRTLSSSIMYVSLIIPFSFEVEQVWLLYN